MFLLFACLSCNITVHFPNLRKFLQLYMSPLTMILIGLVCFCSQNLYKINVTCFWFIIKLQFILLILSNFHNSNSILCLLTCVVLNQNSYSAYPIRLHLCHNILSEFNVNNIEHQLIKWECYMYVYLIVYYFQLFQIHLQSLC